MAVDFYEALDNKRGTMFCLFPENVVIGGAQNRLILMCWSIADERALCTDDPR